MEGLRERSLARQFPAVRGRGPGAVLELLNRLGPIQSQAPRAPFLAVSSRLPGVTYSCVRDLLAAHRLLKTTNIRGTVHTSTRAAFPRLDAVARDSRAPVLRRQLGPVPPESVVAEIEAFCSGRWRPRSAIVAHLSDWLAQRGSGLDASPFGAQLIWGHSGLVRRPREAAWEKRTDAFHRFAYELLPDLDRPPEPTAALAGLVRGHLASYGPVTRADLAYFFGVRLGLLDAALSLLAEEVRPLTGPGGQALLDLAEPPDGPGGAEDLRLLPEFDGLLVGYSGPNRTRFCGPGELDQLWARANGLYAPAVLHRGRLVATWRTVAARGRTDLEVTMLRGHRTLPEAEFVAQVAAVEAGLGIVIGELRVSPARD